MPFPGSPWQPSSGFWKSRWPLLHLSVNVPKAIAGFSVTAAPVEARREVARKAMTEVERMMKLVFVVGAGRAVGVWWL